MQDLYKSQWAGAAIRGTPSKSGRLFGSEAFAKHPPSRSKMTTSLNKYDTGFPADAVEFCPHPLARDILVCGTYKLLEERDRAGKQQRIGRCSFFGVSSDGNLCDSHAEIAGTNPDVANRNVLQEISLPAIPDLKW